MSTVATAAAMAEAMDIFTTGLIALALVGLAAFGRRQ